MADKKSIKKFSYSKLEVYESCSWRYKLTYVDKHFVDTSAIATDYGSLLHYIEEQIAKELQKTSPEDYYLIDLDHYKDLFLNIDIEIKEGKNTKKIRGINLLKEVYSDTFSTKNKNNVSYNEKYKSYLKDGIFRLPNYLSEHTNLEIIGTELPFSLNYRNYTFSGYIDRVFKDTITNTIYVEDIKSWDTIKGHDLKTPLQFVIYALAIADMYNISPADVKCAYDLPYTQEKYEAGSKGYISRGIKKIDKLLDSIEAKDFEPSPSKLCHWCVYSATYPNQPDDAKNLCPYFCRWTPSTNDYSVENEWMGIENHEAILEHFISTQKAINDSKGILIEKQHSQPITLPSNRRFILRSI